MNYKKYTDSLKKISSEICNEEYKELETQFNTLQEKIRAFPEQAGKNFFKQAENVKKQYIQDYINEFCPEFSDERKKKLEEKLEEIDLGKFILWMLILG
ncbi:MAG: hypothetical protein IJP90_16105 [Treponema sp.]|nr:hypothetical protein [Treponema sp.]